MTLAQLQYWPTKLEVARLIWVVRRLHHMIRALLTSTVVWTDHTSTPRLLQQTNLLTPNTDKLNLRFICAAIYLSQFLLNMKYKFDRDHKIPDALFRLSTKPLAQLEILEIEALYGTLIELSNSF